MKAGMPVFQTTKVGIKKHKINIPPEKAEKKHRGHFRGTEKVPNFASAGMMNPKY